MSTDSHPNIMEAIHLIQMDTGDHLAIPVLDVPNRWKDHLPVIEAVLATLSRKERAVEEEPLPQHVKPSELLDSELFSFSNGLDEVQEAMSNRSPDHMLAHIFLNDYFEGWSYTSEEHGNTPQSLASQRRIEHLEMLVRENRNTPEQTDELEQLRLSLV